jgi:hypothetical protein
VAAAGVAASAVGSKTNAAIRSANAANNTIMQNTRTVSLRGPREWRGIIARQTKVTAATTL